jgi:predicted transcriptional regulator
MSKTTRDIFKTRLVGAQVEPDLYARLQEQARREDRSTAALVRQALKQYLALANANGADTIPGEA